MAKIGLLDCNNFFVSCERLFRPDLVKKPVAVLSSNDGCIVARSQEVKDMGIPMGLPLFQAKQLCDTSSITFFSSNFTLYRDISARVMRTLATEVGVCDVYSIDEAFFALSDDIGDTDIQHIRDRVIQNVGIPVSIGVADTKTLAKQASRFAKKGDGVRVLRAEDWEKESKEVSCSSIWGLGRATVTKLATQNIHTADDFMQLPRSFVRKNLGVAGERVFDELHGVVVHSLGDHSDDVQQSITSTRSFAKTTNTLSELESAVTYHTMQCAKKLREKELLCTRVYLEMHASRHSDFGARKGGVEIHLDGATDVTQELLSAILPNVRALFESEVPYKKAGIVLSGLVPTSYRTHSLFESGNTREKNILDQVSDTLQDMFGWDALHLASVLPSRDKSSSLLRSKAYTTNWGDIPSVQTK